MDEELRQELLGLADELYLFLEGVPIEEFLQDPMRQRAVERVLTLFSEAVVRANVEDRNALTKDWQALVRLRAKGLRADDALTPANLYAIADRTIPEMVRNL